jgi:hypothetical protein
MKNILSFIVLATILTSAAFAQRDNRNGGSLTLRDGRNIIRIEIGDDRDDREVLQRVRRLEQAVRDLQDQVYQISTTPRTRTVHTCGAEIFATGYVSGSGMTKIEAIENAMADCKKKDGGIFCSSDKLICETAVVRD